MLQHLKSRNNRAFRNSEPVTFWGAKVMQIPRNIGAQRNAMGNRTDGNSEKSASKVCSERPMQRAFTVLILSLTGVAIPVSHGQSGMAVTLSACSSGPQIYRNVARERDAGYPISTQLHTPISAATPSGHQRSVISAQTHNKLVHEIYAHAGWSPDEVAQRWLERCRIFESHARKGDHSVVVVDSLQ
ncbi:hypothetical protein [Luteibacter sp. W1I16]|uniref:hypothetical protein n=1 Tax=Luteibacter sp. W1I16 TaxID=3373922 RepID=UPI003D208084